MTTGTVCQPDCQNRSATCHATCKTYRAAWEANMRRYKANAERRKVSDSTTKGVNESIKKRGDKIPKY